MVLKISKDKESLLPALADFIVSKSNEFINRDGIFTIALSGGKSPQKLFELLSSKNYSAKIRWEKVLFFFSDERCVPLTSSDSNYGMAKNALFTPMNIGASQIFAVNTSLSPAGAAEDYEKTIRGKVKGNRFHLILLGLGDDAHTASLFPGNKVLKETTALVKDVEITDPDIAISRRISFTAPLINLAHEVAFLTFGSTKDDAVYAAIEGPRNPDHWPAQLVNPVPGNLTWFLDEAAAAKISKT